MGVNKGGMLEKLPSSNVKWSASGWKKRHSVVKSAGGQARRPSVCIGAGGGAVGRMLVGAQRALWDAVACATPLSRQKQTAADVRCACRATWPTPTWCLGTRRRASPWRACSRSRPVARSWSWSRIRVSSTPCHGPRMRVAGRGGCMCQDGPARLARPVRRDAGFLIRTYDADQLWIRVPPGEKDLAGTHKVRSNSASLGAFASW